MSTLITIALWWCLLGTLTWTAIYLRWPEPFSIGLLIASVAVIVLWPFFVVAFVAGGGRRV